MFHCPERGLLFTGDGLVTMDLLGRGAGPQTMENRFHVDHELALSSLDRILDLEADVLLPGHGEAWTGKPAAAAARSGPSVRAEGGALACRRFRYAQSSCFLGSADTRQPSSLLPRLEIGGGLLIPGNAAGQPKSEARPAQNARLDVTGLPPVSPDDQRDKGKSDSGSGNLGVEAIGAFTGLFIGASLLLAAEQLLTSTWDADRCALLGQHRLTPSGHD